MNAEKILNERLMAFIREMHAWEVNAENEIEQDDTLFDNPAWQEKQNAIRQKIYQEYITQRERKYGGVEHFSVGFPPKYDPKKETITNILIDNKKASVFTDKSYAGLPYEVEYKFKIVGEKWLIDVIKKRLKGKEKWDNVIIL